MRFQVPMRGDHGVIRSTVMGRTRLTPNPEARRRGRGGVNSAAARMHRGGETGGRLMYDDGDDDDEFYVDDLEVCRSRLCFFFCD